MAYECILKCGMACHSTDTIGAYHKNKWHSLQLKSKAWTGLDRFGDVQDTTSWENGSVGYYIHYSCYIKILSSVQLQRAQQRKQKERDIAQCSSQPSTSDTCGDVPEEPPTPKRLRSSVGGPLHDKTKCVWCMKGEDMKHSNRARSKLFRLKTVSAWRTFRRHPVTTEDTQLRDRLT